MKIWWTSDTHFGAERTLQLTRRPFASTEEMDKCMIKNYNANVQEDDICYHLGDFGDYERIKELHGRVILIMGNYEECDCKNNFHGDIIAFKQYLLELGFYNVYTKGTWVDGMYLCHKPSDRQERNGIFNLFGHIHRSAMCKRNGLNVGVDCHFYCPVDRDTVDFFKEAILEHYDEEVFQE